MEKKITLSIIEERFVRAFIDVMLSDFDILVSTLTARNVESVS